MLDFCLGLRPDFAAGVLRFSADGASHFADVGALFRLDLWVLGLSLAALAAAFVLCRRKGLRPYENRLGGGVAHGPQKSRRGKPPAEGLGTAYAWLAAADGGLRAGA